MKTDNKSLLFLVVPLGLLAVASLIALGSEWENDDLRQRIRALETSNAALRASQTLRERVAPAICEPVPCLCRKWEVQTLTKRRFSHQHRSLEYMARACAEGRIEWNGLSATIRGE